MSSGTIRAVVATLAWTALTLASYFALRAVLPGDTGVPESDSRFLSLLIVVIVSLVLAVVVSALRWWRAIGYTPPSEWRDTRWLYVVAAIAVAPLLAGIRPIEPSSYTVFIIGFLLTGFAEETMFRGILVKLLDRHSPLMIATIAAILFGLVHLSNIVIRGQTVVIVAQAVGAMADGFGFVALRLRTRTLVPLIFLHAAHDLFLWMGTLPVIPVAVVQDVILLAIGLYLLWGWRPGPARGGPA